MMMARLMIVAALLVLSACGGSNKVSCDEGPYLAAVRAPKVEAPEGLDNLDPLNEVPLPEASPQEPRPADGECLELPPQILKIE